MNNIQTKTIAIFIALIALMAATRIHHFSTALHLPDASLAVFLLAGFYLPRWSFPALLVEAGLVDYVAINYGGVDGWCFSPAYWFLIPTYAVLWIAGRYYARIHRYSLRSLGVFSGIAFAALSAAFLISNASFFWVSGLFPNMGMGEYAASVAQYYLPYLNSAVVYLIPATLLQALFARRAGVAHSAVK